MQLSASQRLMWLCFHASFMRSPKMAACAATPFSSRFSMVVVACPGRGRAIPDRICLSPQCGFASCEIGNKLTEEQQWAKLELVKSVAEEIWK